MTTLANLFVQKPLHILAVAAIFLVIWLAGRYGGIAAIQRPSALLVPLGLWLVYALWEWAVLLRTPEADVRVDLLLIWPVLAIASIWAIVMALRS